MLTLAALFVVTMQIQAHAATTEFPVKGSEKILISVPDAIINIQAANAKTLRVTLVNGAQEDYVAQLEGNIIEIKPKVPGQKETFGKFAAKKRIIEISGPSLPLEIHAFDGQIQMNKWAKEALLHLQKGRIVSRDGVGTLAVHSQAGEISILNHQGRVDVDTYKASVTVQNLNGDAGVGNFSGDTTVDKARGFLSLSQTQGSAKVLGSSGTLQFEVTKGSLNIQKFKGRVEGQTQEGPVSLTMGDDTDVNIKSQSGKVTLQAPAGSGASLNLASVEGHIFVPSYLKVVREGSQKSFRGRLKGDAQKGSVLIRSQAGAITIR